MCDHDAPYELSFPQTYGGAAGTYAIKSPYNTGDCEFCVYMISFKAMGTAYLVNNVNTQIQISNIATTSQASPNTTTDQDGVSATPGMLFQSGIQQMYPMLEVWIPMIRAQRLQFTVVGGPITATLIWRKRTGVRAAMPALHHSSNPDDEDQVMAHHGRTLAAQLNRDEVRNGR